MLVVIYLYELLRVPVNFINLLTWVLLVEDLILSQDILVCFLDCIGILCGSSKWFIRFSSGLIFGIRIQLRSFSWGCEKIGIRATSYLRESTHRVK